MDWFVTWCYLNFSFRCVLILECFAMRNEFPIRVIRNRCNVYNTYRISLRFKNSTNICNSDNYNQISMQFSLLVRALLMQLFRVQIHSLLRDRLLIRSFIHFIRFPFKMFVNGLRFKRQRDQRDDQRDQNQKLNLHSATEQNQCIQLIPLLRVWLQYF